MTTSNTQPQRQIYNNFTTDRMYGAQNWGNMIYVLELQTTVEQVDPSENDGFSEIHEDEWVRISKQYWIPCKTQHELETRNQIGGLGAYRDVPNQLRVDELITKLKIEFEVV